MITITPESFRPTDALIYILYAKIVGDLPEEARERMLYFTREQFSYGFASAIEAIREWQVCREVVHSHFWLVDSSCRLRTELLREIHRRIELQKDAYLDNPEFKLRFAEEIMAWSLKQKDNAKKCGIEWDHHRNLILVRKNQESIDTTGCA